MSVHSRVCKLIPVGACGNFQCLLLASTLPRVSATRLSTTGFSVSLVGEVHCTAIQIISVAEPSWSCGLEASCVSLTLALTS